MFLKEPVTMVHIHPLSRAQLERVMERSEVVERDGHGIKVLRLSDGRYLKYFRRKRFFNRELLSPAAVEAISTGIVISIFVDSAFLPKR